MVMSALSSLLLLTGIILGIYGFDFYKLRAGEVQIAQGNCYIEFNDNGKSIATTSVEIDETVYQIKSDTHKVLPDLTVTRNIETLEIENK